MLADLLPRLASASPLGFALDTRPCLALDLSAANPALRGLDPGDTAAFSAWIGKQIRQAGAGYAAGGYGEDRQLYRMSTHFGDPGADETRTLHLGIDLWVEAGTSVHAVLPGVVHSTADNAHFGDYGPTVIVEHDIAGHRFHTLYGHLSADTLSGLHEGQALAAGERLGAVGAPPVNGRWPPHLHLQVIAELGSARGDYPGVCKPSEAAAWLARCPDPNRLLRIAALGPPR